MGVDWIVALASAWNWVVGLVLVLLLLGYYALVIWWISRFGARDVAARFATSQPPEQALRAWVDYYGPWLATADYRVVDETPQRVEFAGRYRPRWEIALAVLLFPLGLVFLLGSKPAHVVASTTDAGIAADGHMHRRMANALEREAAQTTF